MTIDYRDPDDFGDGLEDQLEALESLDLEKTEDFDQLLRQMARTAFTGRRLGEAAEVLAKMISDPDCGVVGTFSGAMSVAKMGLLICNMIDWGWLDIIISTGALIAHGFVEAAGMIHFKHDDRFDDATLYHRGYNRVYDTLELEKNLDRTEEIISGILDKMDTSAPLSSERFCRELGAWLAENTDKPGILRNAYLKEVPVYIPAFTDSELGLDVNLINRLLRSRGESKFSFDPFLDLDHFTDLLRQHEKLGIFTVGGGVPRNWAQQVAPYIDILGKRVPDQFHPPCRYRYAVRICPEPVEWGSSAI